MKNNSIYPRWFNIISLIILSLVPIGLVITFFQHLIGVLIMGIGFLGIWVFGTLAKRYRLNQWPFKNKQ